MTISWPRPNHFGTPNGSKMDSRRLENRSGRGSVSMKSTIAFWKCIFHKILCQSEAVANPKTIENTDDVAQNSTWQFYIFECHPCCFDDRFWLPKWLENWFQIGVKLIRGRFGRCFKRGKHFEYQKLNPGTLPVTFFGIRHGHFGTTNCFKMGPRRFENRSRKGFHGHL